MSLRFAEKTHGCAPRDLTGSMAGNLLEEVAVEEIQP
jgi:hypothetical protein